MGIADQRTTGQSRAGFERLCERHGLKTNLNRRRLKAVT
jgi:hypothetical protein